VDIHFYSLIEKVLGEELLNNSNNQVLFIIKPNKIYTKELQASEEALLTQAIQNLSEKSRKK
jgi:hypothetical protein